MKGLVSTVMLRLGNRLFVLRQVQPLWTRLRTRLHTGQIRIFSDRPRSSIRFTFAAFYTTIFLFLISFSLCSLSSALISRRARIFCHQQLLALHCLSRVRKMPRNKVKAAAGDSSRPGQTSPVDASAENRCHEMQGVQRT